MNPVRSLLSVLDTQNFPEVDHIKEFTEQLNDAAITFSWGERQVTIPGHYEGTVALDVLHEYCFILMLHSKTPSNRLACFDLAQKVLRFYQTKTYLFEAREAIESCLGSLLTSYGRRFMVEDHISDYANHRISPLFEFKPKEFATSFPAGTASKPSSKLKYFHDTSGRMKSCPMRRVTLDVMRQLIDNNSN